VTGRDAGLRGRGLAVEAGTRLLSGLDLDVAPGEVCAVTGASGVGKTTLLRALAGLIDFAEGEVRLGGQIPADIGWPTFRRRVVYVAQRPALHEESVEATLARPFRYRSAKGAFSAGRAEELLARVGVGAERLSQEARSLSVGQQQRVCVVRGLLVEPEFLLADEPTSALDAEAVRAVEELLREEAHLRQMGVLVVTHDAAQAERFCDRRIDLGPFAAPEKAIG
jgi:putative ABC transport system ATP-binding protein